MADEPKINRYSFYSPENMSGITKNYVNDTVQSRLGKLVGDLDIIREFNSNPNNDSGYKYLEKLSETINSIVDPMSVNNKEDKESSTISPGM